MQLTIWYSDFRDFEDVAHNFAVWTSTGILRIVRTAETFVVVEATEGNDWAIRNFY